MFIYMKINLERFLILATFFKFFTYLILPQNRPPTVIFSQSAAFQTGKYHITSPRDKKISIKDVTALKSDNLQYNMLGRWVDGMNDSSTKHLMFQALFFFS